MMPVPIESFDLAAHVTPGDRIVIGQATAEPVTLTRELVRRAPEIPGCNVFMGTLYSDTFLGEGADALTLDSYGAIGKAATLAARGRLNVTPTHYSAIDRAFALGERHVDCVMLTVAPNPFGDGFNLSLSNDYTITAARRARTVLVSVDPNAPVCVGADWPHDVPIHGAVNAAVPPPEQPCVQPMDVESTIGGHVASLVPDGAVLQIGVGAIPNAVLAALRHHRDLGIHSGALMDGIVDLAACGAITNARKEHDTGLGVGGLLLGTRKLFDFMNGNPDFRLRPVSQTHSLSVMGGLSNFRAINSAVEVDLTGQINAETAGGNFVGAVGGQVDFVRGAAASPGGRSIIALPSTARKGTISRIVPKTATVTCARSDADIVVTEWGVADLRGMTLPQRAERMIAIAAPEFREDLSRYWRASGGGHHA